MNENLYANLKAYADLQRNAFPLDNKQTYSQKLGEITPVKCFRTIPGDYFDVSFGDKSLSFPMNTAAFLDARKEIVAYHVPFNHLNSLFNQLQATRPDPKTSALVNLNDVVGGEKVIDLHQLYFAVMAQHLAYCFFKHIAPIYFNMPMDSYELYSDGYNIVLEIDFGGSDTTVTVNAFPQGIDLENGVGAVQIFDHYVDSQAFFDILGRWRVYNWCRKLDMLGYGNLYPLLKKVEQAFEYIHSKHKDFGPDSDGTVDVENLDPLSSKELGELGYAIQYAYLRLCQMAFANVTYSITQHVFTVDPSLPRRLSVYPILAYNKVFYDFFRNSYYDLDYDVKDYNIDFLYNAENQASAIDIRVFSPRFLDIEYHQYKKDLITGSLPSAQFGAVSGLTLNLDLSGLSTGDGSWSVGSGAPQGSLPLTLYKRSNGSVSNYVTVDGSNYSSEHTHSVIGSEDSQVGFDVLQLKRAEMLQEYRQVLLRNGNKTSDIFKGIYGHAPASEDDNSPRFLDAFGSQIFVDTIVSTADTATEDSVKGSLGDLGARSVINTGGKFQFKTSDFGCLLFLSYIVPENEYSSTMLDEHLLASDPESHFLPFFQNLGFQPIHQHNINMYAMASNSDTIRGYAPSYSKYKQELSLAHGNFAAVSKNNLFGTRYYQDFETYNFDDLHSAGFFDDFVGSFNHWVALNDVVQNLQATTLAQFYISPSMWDNVFVTKAGEDFESDHFVSRMEFNIKSVRVLSKLGLPNF